MPLDEVCTETQDRTGSERLQAGEGHGWVCMLGGSDCPVHREW